MISKVKQVIAEYKRSQALDRELEDALIDPTFLDRAEFHARRPIDREPTHIPVKGDQEPQSIFVRIIRPRSIDGVFAR